MLKYKVRLTEDNMDMETMVWSEKYLAPNLSFVSGVTSQHYHLENYNKLAVTNKLMSNPNAIVNVESENVTRQGYVIIKGKQYESFSDSIIDYSVESGGTVVDYNYLFLNGKYYYLDSANTYHIDNWLTETFEEDEDGNIRPKIVEKDIEVSGDAKIDTIAWIEDGIVNIDGYGYYYDRDIKYSSSASIGGLKFYEDGDILVICSDGILESNKEYLNKELWIKYLLEDINTDDVQQIADILLKEAIDNDYGQEKDDMTVIVAKVKTK